MRIAIIEDEVQLLNDLATVLELKGYKVPYQCKSVSTFMEELNLNVTPDLLLLDIILDKSNALTQIDKIKLLLPRLKIIVITGQTDESYLFQALGQGVDGFFIKGNKFDELSQAIQTCMNGNPYVSPSSAKQLISRLRNEKNAPEGTLLNQNIAKRYNLVPREQEVLNGLIQHLQYKEIAENMHLSINTIRHYVVSLYQKLNVNKRKELLEKIRQEFDY